jgi:paraquat-inducible protein A
MPITTTDSIESSWIACHECDLLLNITELAPKEKASCPRCQFTLTVNRRNICDKILAYSIASLIFLFITFGFPFITLVTQGQERTITLLQTISVLFEQHYFTLSALITFFVLIAPIAFLLGIINVVISIKQKNTSFTQRQLLRSLTSLAPWSMVEIFVVGLLVSLIKIISLADITLDLAFYSFVLFSICLTSTFLHVDKVQLWRLVKENGN